MIKTTKTKTTVGARCNVPLLRRTVLIADDEPEIIKFLRSIFVKEGYRVTSVRNGRDVLKKVKKGDIDLVILDVIMPVMSGMETLRELRKMAPRLPVIVVTGYGDLQSVREAMLLGARDYVTKPFDVSFMKATVRQTLGKRAASTLASVGSPPCGG